ncbi:hypothetical protein CBOM_01920 [Ceraceosorus bombacis]|uniref:Uncharacterized protein n=1 Tax=Ceraceosorus bombacis TaxID=401625 RepID=A0A0N7L9K5_9BASI|nr:hypothetical protein CBOM_01920 [Ceraceosorus bombacis]
MGNNPILLVLAISDAFGKPTPSILASWASSESLAAIGRVKKSFTSALLRTAAFAGSLDDDDGGAICHRAGFRSRLAPPAAGLDVTNLPRSPAHQQDYADRGVAAQTAASRAPKMSVMNPIEPASPPATPISSAGHAVGNGYGRRQQKAADRKDQRNANLDHPMRAISLEGLPQLLTDMRPRYPMDELNQPFSAASRKSVWAHRQH